MKIITAILATFTLEPNREIIFDYDDDSGNSEYPTILVVGEKGYYAVGHREKGTKVEYHPVRTHFYVAPKKVDGSKTPKPRTRPTSPVKKNRLFHIEELMFELSDQAKKNPIAAKGEIARWVGKFSETPAVIHEGYAYFLPGTTRITKGDEISSDLSMAPSPPHLLLEVKDWKVKFNTFYCYGRGNWMPLRRKVPDGVA